MSNTNCKQIRLILGDQLNHDHSWFEQVDDEVVYCLFETHSEATYVRHHIQKVVGFFAAMRRFADELRADGHQVIYQDLNATKGRPSISANLAYWLSETKAASFAYQAPDEYRLDQELADFCASCTLPTEMVDTEHFLSGRYTVQALFAGKKTYLMETFYRQMRKAHDILMDGEGRPLTGQWNYDQDNRGKLPKDMTLPTPIRFDHDVSQLVELLISNGIATIGSIDEQAFNWPISREESLAVLADFCTNRLIHFGTYQDAMTVRDPLLFHARISFALNVKMLSPLEVVNAAIKTWEQAQETITFNQLEGFVRQIVGWREYMRGVYWAQMPEYAKKNYFNHQGDLPEWYWTGKTKMNCLSHAIGQSLDGAYAHHIQRLMVTGNFALLIGADPSAVDTWYLGIYIDAIEWVEITNTRGMSQWADGGLLATKPYVSSANYINKMSDYCGSCYYKHREKTGAKACPFNSLYWDFLDRHAKQLRNNFRMGMMYRIWDKYEAATQAEILERAAWVKDNLDEL